MANIRIDLQDLVDGMEVVFQAPADCSQITGLIIYYPSPEDGSEIYKIFSFTDAHGNDLSSINELFAAGVYVKVILDIVNNHAYIQNADTNGYLENHIQNKNNPHGVTASDVGAFYKIANITSGSMNDYFKEGIYHIKSGSFVANITELPPDYPNAAGEVFVIRDTQFVMTYVGGGRSFSNIWVRSKFIVDNVINYRDWVRLVTDEDLAKYLLLDGSVAMIGALELLTHVKLNSASKKAHSFVAVYDSKNANWEVHDDENETILRLRMYGSRANTSELSQALKFSAQLAGEEEKHYALFGEHNMCPDGAGAHNATYRGKALGNVVTAEQWARINDGTFRDLYIGDYWTIGGINYRIAAFDYYYNTGDTACTKHHVTLVPDTNMYTHVMNDTNITTGAYIGSKMYTKGLTQAKTTINNAFGSAHILNHRQYLHNAVTNGYPSGGSWYDSTVELMTEQNVYGGKVFGSVINGTAFPHLYTVDKSQYPLFTFRPDMISNRQWFWLRDVVSSAYFADVDSYGNAGNGNASNAGGVRPAFSIIS